ncbi:UNVERIFIED_CONTAM: hypothetical protein FKN15_070300 [Acipenser sinensis]
MQVHKETIDGVPNAIPGRTDIELEIYGMEGIPEKDMEERRRVLEQKTQAESQKKKQNNADDSDDFDDDEEAGPSFQQQAVQPQQSYMPPMTQPGMLPVPGAPGMPPNNYSGMPPMMPGVPHMMPGMPPVMPGMPPGMMPMGGMMPPGPGMPPMMHGMHHGMPPPVGPRPGMPLMGQGPPVTAQGLLSRPAQSVATAPNPQPPVTKPLFPSAGQNDANGWHDASWTWYAPYDAWHASWMVFVSSLNSVHMFVLPPGMPPPVGPRPGMPLMGQGPPVTAQGLLSRPAQSVATAPNPQPPVTKPLFPSAGQMGTHVPSTSAASSSADTVSASSKPLFPSTAQAQQAVSGPVGTDFKPLNTPATSAEPPKPTFPAYTQSTALTTNATNSTVSKPPATVTRQYGGPPQGMPGYMPGGMPPYGQGHPMVPPFQGGPPRPPMGMRPPVMSQGGRY